MTSPGQGRVTARYASGVLQTRWRRIEQHISSSSTSRFCCMTGALGSPVCRSRPRFQGCAGHCSLSDVEPAELLLSRSASATRVQLYHVAHKAICETSVKSMCLSLCSCTLGTPYHLRARTFTLRASRRWFCIRDPKRRRSWRTRTRGYRWRARLLPAAVASLIKGIAARSCGSLLLQMNLNHTQLSKNHVGVLILWTGMLYSSTCVPHVFVCARCRWLISPVAPILRRSLLIHEGLACYDCLTWIFPCNDFNHNLAACSRCWLTIFKRWCWLVGLGALSAAPVLWRMETWGPACCS